jgi:hypothetical protein
MSRQRWQLTPAVVGGDSGRQRLTAADGRMWPLVFDGGDRGKLMWQQWSVDNKYGVQWRWWRWRLMVEAAFDGV